MNRQEAKLFVPRYIAREYASGEYEAFLGWLDEAALTELEEVIEGYELLHDRWPLAARPSEQWMEQMREKLKLADKAEKQAPVRRLPGRLVRNPVWRVAASVVLIAAGAYLWHVYRPGPNRASSGGSSENATGTIFHITVPRGGQQRLVSLADGSKVWLNAGSALSYPVAFAGNERRVEISGEGFFEVAADPARPFHVKAKDMDIEVLGTQFNVKAFEDEASMKTSLVEGSVKITRGEQTVTLKPGDQASVSYSASDPVQGNNISGIVVRYGLDPKVAQGWKAGNIVFNDDDLRSVMREISRRYDLDVRYEGKLPDQHFTGKLSGDADVQQVLKILVSQHIHFSIEGNIIMVRP